MAVAVVGKAPAAAPVLETNPAAAACPPALGVAMGAGGLRHVRTLRQSWTGGWMQVQARAQGQCEAAAARHCPGHPLTCKHAQRILCARGQDLPHSTSGFSLRSSDQRTTCAQSCLLSDHTYSGAHFCLLSDYTYSPSLIHTQGGSLIEPVQV